MKNPSDPFYEFYRAELLPLLRPIEQNRKNKLLKLILLIALTFFIIIAASWYLSDVISIAKRIFEIESKTELYLRTLVFIFMGCAASFSFIYYFIKKFYLIDYSIQFKYFVLPKLISHLDSRLTYFKNEGLSEHFLEMSQLFNKQYNSLNSEDKVEGVIGKTKVAMTEYFYEQKDIEGDKRNENYLFIMADFNKHFFKQIMVTPKNIFSGLKGCPALLSTLYKFQLKKVKMDSPGFNKRFSTRTNDSIVAHYVLTPNLMDRMIQFSQNTKNPVFFSFYASSLYIVIPYKKRLFEPRLFSSMISYKTICEYHEILKLSLAIVNDLNLNTRIWTKE